MACCGTLQNIPRDCGTNVGGIRRAWMACHGDITSVTVDANDVVTAITPTTSPPWYQFDFRKQTGSVTTTITTDDAAGTLYYESAIVLQFTKQEAEKRMAINALALSDLAIIIEDNNGIYWYFGADFEVTLTDGTGETGTAFGDLNGYNITLTDLARQLPYTVEASVVEEIINAIAGINAGTQSIKSSVETSSVNESAGTSTPNTPKAKTKK